MSAFDGFATDWTTDSTTSTFTISNSNVCTATPTQIWYTRGDYCASSYQYVPVNRKERRASKSRRRTAPQNHRMPTAMRLLNDRESLRKDVSHFRPCCHNPKTTLPVNYGWKNREYKDSRNCKYRQQWQAHP